MGHATRRGNKYEHNNTAENSHGKNAAEKWSKLQDNIKMHVGSYCEGLNLTVRTAVNTATNRLSTYQMLKSTTTINQHTTSHQVLPAADLVQQKLDVPATAGPHVLYKIKRSCSLSTSRNGGANIAPLVLTLGTRR